jgi:hypothetical protein
MSRWSVVLGIIAATLAALCALLYRGLLDERASRLELAAELAEARRTDVRQAVGGLPAVADREPAAVPSAMPATPPAAGSEQARESLAQRQALEQRRRNLRDPELRAALLDQQRYYIARTYPDLADDLGWTQEQAEQFVDLMARQRLEMEEFTMDLTAQLVPEGRKPTAEQVLEAQRRAHAERQRQQDEQKLLLGEDRHLKWLEYEQSREARAQLQALRTRLAAGSSPLNQEQFDQLVPMLAAEQRRLHEEVAALHATQAAAGGDVDQDQLGTRRVELLADSQRRVLEALKPYLDSAQLQQLRALHSAELSQANNRLRMQRAMRALESQDGSP